MLNVVAQAATRIVGVSLLGLALTACGAEQPTSKSPGNAPAPHVGNNTGFAGGFATASDPGGTGQQPGEQPGETTGAAPPVDESGGTGGGTGGAGGTEPGASGTGGTGTPDPPATDPDAPPSGPLDACNASAGGVLQDDTAPVSYGGNPVYVTGTHNSSGCLTQMEIEFWKDDACPLTLNFQGGGAWKLTSATIQSDPQCGQGWGSGKTYSMQSSTATIFDAPTTVADKAAPKSCTVLEQPIRLGGDITFEFDQVTFTVNLNDLTVNGMVLSNAGAGSCGSEPAACEGMVCGTDSFGNACGQCSAGEFCSAGQCTASACPPAGPYGTNKGNVMQSFSLPNCDGSGDVTMHELGCGENASIFKMFAAY